MECGLWFVSSGVAERQSPLQRTARILTVVRRMIFVADGRLDAWPEKKIEHGTGMEQVGT
ncbi:MAG: hypothetical protein ACT4N2_00955 [Hyphomicrobium sp.]